MCAFSDRNLSTVLDDDLKQEDTSHDPSGPRIHCPLCGWSPRKDDKWFCTCGKQWNTFDTGESAQPACTSGMKPNASRAVDGRRTPSGMRLREK